MYKYALYDGTSVYLSPLTCLLVPLDSFFCILLCSDRGLYSNIGYDLYSQERKKITGDKENFSKNEHAIDVYQNWFH